MSYNVRIDYFRYFPDSPLLLKNLNFTFEKGNIYGIKGANGSGKTTLLYLLSGIIPRLIRGELNGSITLNNKDIQSLSLTDIGSNIGLLMFEPDNQLIFSTVGMELTFAAENYGIPPEIINARKQEILEMLKIGDLTKTEVQSMSHGQKKLIIFASLYIYNPDFYLLDEPYSGLDKKSVTAMIALICRLRSEGKTVVMTDHTGNSESVVNLQIEL